MDEKVKWPHTKGGSMRKLMEENSRLKSLLSEKEKEIERIGIYNSCLQQEISKFSAYLKLSGDWRLLSEQVIERVKERENVISLLQTNLGEMKQYLHNAKTRINDLEQGMKLI